MAVKDTDVGEFFSDLEAGIFEQKLGRSLSEVAQGVIATKKGGKVVITLSITPIGASQQVKVASKLDYKIPTNSGSMSEDMSADTPLYVGVNGQMTMFSKDQSDMFNHKEKN